MGSRLIFRARRKRHAQTSRPDVQWPSVCTVEKWLRRHGLVKERKRRKRVPLYSEPFLECDAPNKVWSADFKGQFRMGDGKWCYPLTLSDNMSRYLLVCRGVGSTSHEDTQKWFEWAFRKYGHPHQYARITARRFRTRYNRSEPVVSLVDKAWDQT